MNYSLTTVKVIGKVCSYESLMNVESSRHQWGFDCLTLVLRFFRLFLFVLYEEWNQFKNHMWWRVAFMKSRHLLRWREQPMEHLVFSGSYRVFSWSQAFASGSLHPKRSPGSKSTGKLFGNFFYWKLELVILHKDWKCSIDKIWNMDYFQVTMTS